MDLRQLERLVVAAVGLPPLLRLLLLLLHVWRWEQRLRLKIRRRCVGVGLGKPSSSVLTILNGDWGRSPLEELM
jgi:hypothetical protein